VPFEQDVEYGAVTGVDPQSVELPDVAVGRVHAVAAALLDLGFRDQRDGFHLPDLPDRLAVRDRVIRRAPALSGGQ
jgi:hypothetical protein